MRLQQPVGCLPALPQAGGPARLFCGTCWVTAPWQCSPPRRASTFFPQAERPGKFVLAAAMGFMVNSLAYIVIQASVGVADAVPHANSHRIVGIQQAPTEKSTGAAYTITPTCLLPACCCSRPPA